MRRRRPSPAVPPLATIADEADDRVRAKIDARPERGCLSCQVGEHALSLCRAWVRDDPRDGSPILRHNGRFAALSRFEEAGNVESSLLNRGGVDDWERFHALIVPLPCVWQSRFSAWVAGGLRAYADLHSLAPAAEERKTEDGIEV